jgi:MobA-like NTP transferase domain
VPAVVAAGDRGAARAIHGESKAYLTVGERPLVTRVVAELQRVPEVSEVMVVGDAARLVKVLGDDESLRRELRKPLSVVPQFRNLYENAWETYRRLLPGAGPAGRDPESEADRDQAVLYLSADLPFATAEEISAFVRRSLEGGADFNLGLVGEEAMEGFYPEPGKPGIRMAYFNLRQGRLRQSNLHLVRPARLGNRHYVEEMYEHRYQRQLGHVIALAWRVLTRQGGGVAVLLSFALMHLVGLLDRLGLRRTADALRRYLDLERVGGYCGRLLDTRFRFVVTEAGGCAVDLDNDHDFDVARLRFDEWRPAQEARARALYGPLALPERAGASAPAELRLLQGGSG